MRNSFGGSAGKSPAAGEAAGDPHRRGRGLAEKEAKRLTFEAPKFLQNFSPTLPFLPFLIPFPPGGGGGWE